MVHVLFDIQTVNDDVNDDNEDTWLDPLETAMMLDHTRGQINAHVQRALDGLTCPTHNEAPQVTINGTYDAQAEALDIQYDVQTCCQLFLMQCIAALNRR